MARVFNRTKSPFEEPTVNLTPLIDVVFVILIMFIVVAPLLELDRIELADASSEAQNQKHVQESSPISIYVRQDNAILYNNRKVEVGQLLTLLKEAKVKHPKAKPQLFHDRKAYFGTYQQVKNAAEAAGFDQMDIILKPS
jgi:biopolymer transport protein ExbD